MSEPCEPLEILHRDDHLVAILKPAWAVVHPTRGAAEAPVVVHDLANQLGRPVFPVHRLDRQTSGVLVLGLGPGAARALCEQFREGAVEKEYVGLCRGVLPDTGPILIDHPVPDGDVRKPGVTVVEPVRAFHGRYTFFRARPRTGRRHQIRYHMKHRSHHLVGDVTYGKGAINRFFRVTMGLERLFLHASRIRLACVATGRKLEIAAPLPADLERVLARLESHVGPVP